MCCCICVWVCGSLNWLAAPARPCVSPGIASLWSCGSLPIAIDFAINALIKWPRSLAAARKRREFLWCRSHMRVSSYTSGAIFIPRVGFFSDKVNFYKKFFSFFFRFIEKIFLALFWQKTIQWWKRKMNFVVKIFIYYVTIVYLKGIIQTLKLYAGHPQDLVKCNSDFDVSIEQFFW